MLRPGGQDHQAGDQRGEEGDTARVSAQDILCELDDVVKSPCGLHQRKGCDHRQDHSQNGTRRAAGWEPEQEDEYEEPAHRPEANSPQAGPDHDRGQEHQQFHPKKHGIHAIRVQSRVPTNVSMQGRRMALNWNRWQVRLENGPGSGLPG